MIKTYSDQSIPAHHTVRKMGVAGGREAGYAPVAHTQMEDG